MSNPKRRADYDQYGEREDEERGEEEEQVEEGDEEIKEVPHYWTVEELEQLLSQLNESKELSKDGRFPLSCFHYIHSILILSLNLSLSEFFFDCGSYSF